MKFRVPLRTAKTTVAAFAFFWLGSAQPLNDGLQAFRAASNPKDLAIYSRNAAPDSSLPKLPSVSDSIPPDFLFWANIAECKMRFYRNGIPVDSGLISPGRGTPSPIIEVERNLLELRPSFTPTDNEKAKGFRSCGPEKSDPPAVPKNPLGRVRIIISSAFRMHGTFRPQFLGHPASNGCIRVDNFFIERSADTLIARLPLEKHRGVRGRYESYVFKAPFSVRLSYRLWDALQTAMDTLKFIAFKDIHRHLARTVPPKKCPMDEEVSGNGYRLEHLLADLQKIGVRPKPGLDAQSGPVQQFWKEFVKLLKSNPQSGSSLSIQLPQDLFDLPAVGK